jgi:hypothetical protein
MNPSKTTPISPIQTSLRRKLIREFPSAHPSGFPSMSSIPINSIVEDLQAALSQFATIRWLPMGDYWRETITELRGDLLQSGKLNDALVDAFLTQYAAPNWWTQTIAFTAVHARAPGS